MEGYDIDSNPDEIDQFQPSWRFIRPGNTRWKEIYEDEQRRF